MTPNGCFWTLVLSFLFHGQEILAGIETTYGSWSKCSKIAGSLDQNCRGTQSRSVTSIETDDEGKVKSTDTWTESQNCLLTTQVIDGGYTTWSAWADCSTRCDKSTTRTRTCHNPTPCNGGKDCSDLGRTTLSKTCRPAIGEWGSWQPWQSCNMPSASNDIYGTGTRIRDRFCDSPPPVCGGDFCIGNSNETGNCRVVPNCLTYQMFSDKFLRDNSPMVIYASSQVDVYLLTKNICSTKVIVQTYYQLFKMNTTAEYVVSEKIWNVKFRFDPGQYAIGYYRLYAWIGYTMNGGTHWMEESMYVKIEHPPPHAFIKGGVGRIVGQGDVHFDARSVSYSLTKGPGDPSGLSFDFRCLGFLTHAIYNLLKFNIDTKLVFGDVAETKKKWYETQFLLYIENKMAFVRGSSVSRMVNTMKNSGVSCLPATQIYVKAELNKYKIKTTTPSMVTYNETETDSTTYRSTEGSTQSVESSTHSLDGSTQPCVTNVTECIVVVKCENNTDTNTTEKCINVTECSSNITDCTVASMTYPSTTPAPTYDSVPLTYFYDIIYMEEMQSDPDLLLTTNHILPLPDNTTLIKNEMDEFIQSLNDEESLSFPDDTQEFFKLLSESSLTLDSLYQLNGLPGLPESANQTFFEELYDWLNKANVSKVFANELIYLLEDFKNVGVFVSSALKLVDIIGMDKFLRLSIDESGGCLINQLGSVFEGFEKIDSYNWNDMKLKEQSYLDWMETQLLISSACKNFTAQDNGTGNLLVTSEDVNQGLGFLLYLRVEFDGSVSYFIQHAQTKEGNPPELEIECRLNCMKKTALTSIMSLKATCPSCTLDQQKNARFWWNVKHFDMFSRETVDTNNWQTWMLSELETRKFVMKAGALNASSGYLVEAFIEINGESSSAIWTITTNILPYDGSCELRNASWGEKNVSTFGWKDEGFRTSTDLSLDWKEQLNYRIVQTTSAGKETMLYYGSEEQNFIKLKPGVVEDNYEVNVKIQIYDIFIDYAECNIGVGQILPDYQTSDESSVSSFLSNSSEIIDYYWKVKNIKQVGMNTEVAGTSVKDMVVNSTILDTDPSDWLNLGVVKNPDGSNTTQTFDDLWNSYKNPDYGDVSSQNEIKQKLTNFSTLLTDVSDLVSGASTVNLEQIATSIGTTVGNKYFTENSSASNAFKGTHFLVDKLESLAYNETYPKFEDFIQTCEGVLRVLNNALEALLPQMSADQPSELDIYSVINDLTNRQTMSETPDADLTTTERAFIAQQIAMKNELEKSYKDELVRNEVPTLLDDIQRLGHVLAMLNYRKQMPVYAQSGYINSTENNKDMGELLQRGFSTNGVSLNLTASASAPTGEQNVQVTLYDHTPFSWDKESTFITSKTVSVNIGTNDKKNTAIPSTISIPSPVSTVTPKTIRLAIPDTDEPSSQLILYRFFWKTPSDTLIFEVRNAVPDANHTVFIRQKVPPDPTDNVYDRVIHIGLENWEHNMIKLMITGDLYTKPVNVYIGILVQGNSTTSNSNRRRRSIVNTTNVDYEITSSTTGCRVWDDSSQTWDKTSCQLSASSTVSNTVCVCSNPPGNNFATTFYVPPNTIDFGTVFQKFNLKDNAAVFATVISLVVLYLLICIWAFRQDKHDLERWSLSYLIDNGPFDEYLYVLSVYTGLHRNAATNSKVYFMIIDGTNRRKDTSSIRCLDDDKHQGFGVGSIRRFVMSVPSKIRDPSVIKIWHDNSGEGNSASWYLDKLILEDVQTNERYIFICDRWLSLDEDDGCIDCAIPVCNQSDTHRFSFLFNEKTKQNTTDGHLWLSVAIRPEDSNFTRMERLACCLALLFLTMISNAMFYGQDTGGKITLGPISFSLTGIYISFISALIVAPPIFFITFMFRKSKKRVFKQRNKKSYKKQNEPALPIKPKRDLSHDMNIDVTNNSDFPLPFWCRYIAWLIVSVAVLVSGFFLILYSMEWGKSKAEAWLACFFLSFFESLFIVDPLKIILLSVVLSWIVKSYNVDTVKYDKEKLLLETKRRTASPLSYLFSAYKRQHAPVRPSKVDKMKEQRKLKLRVQKTFVEFVFYVIFLSFLYLVSYSNRDPRWFYLKNHLDHHLITSTKGSTSIKFNEIHSTRSLYKWLNETLLPFMFPRFQTNGEKLLAYERQYVNDLANFRVGPMRIRQVRSNSEKCVVHHFANSTCYDSYSILKEDDQSYCVGWNSPPCNVGQNVSFLTAPAWSFISSVDIWGFPITGLHTMYNGGGFISEFIVNFNVSRTMLNELYENVWIDRKSRAVFAEFTLYNVDNNVFVYTSFLCEMADTGGTTTSYNIQMFRPYQHVGSLGLFIFVCELIVFVGTIVFAVQKGIHIYRHGKKTLKEFWNVLDIIIIISFLVCAVMYVGRWIMINVAMEKFEEDKNKFVNFSHISYWDELFNIFLSFTIFVTTFRIMRILSYNERINQLSSVLKYVVKELCGCFVMFLIVYVAFTVYGYLLFGRVLETYKNVMVSSTTLVNAIIGKNSINDLFSVEPVLGRVYYFCFVLFLLWILMTMLNASLNFGITAVRSKPVPAFYGISDIIKDVWKNALELLRKNEKPVSKPVVDVESHLMIRKSGVPLDIDVFKSTASLGKRRKRIYINM